MLSRMALLAVLLALAACAGDPRSLGITGPGKAPASATVDTPGAGLPGTDMPDPLQSGSRFAPSVVPTTSGGRYWGYD